MGSAEIPAQALAFITAFRERFEAIGEDRPKTTLFSKSSAIQKAQGFCWIPSKLYVDSFYLLIRRLPIKIPKALIKHPMGCATINLALRLQEQ